MAGSRLWAPWRLEYIKGVKPEECIFCAKPREDSDEAAYILHRGERAFVILNAFPYNNGHLMVAPFAHIGALEELPAETLAEMMALTQKVLSVLKATYAPEGFNIGVNQGKVAGAGVEHHIHLHIVPRWGADTNFMPVLSDTRILPQHLSASYEALKRAWNE